MASAARLEEEEMSDIRFAAGTWIYGTAGDRYLLGGYREGLDVLARIRMLADVEGITGVEMLYPGDFTHGVEEVGEAIASSGLDCAVVGVDLAGDPRWRYGSLSSREGFLREEAVALTHETIDAAAALGADRVNLWPGEDGFDYPFQVDHSQRWEWFRDGLAAVGSYRGDMQICLEYKIREPRVRSLIGTAAEAVLMCREVGLENVGVTIDTGHSLQAGESVSAAAAMLARDGLLFHLHLNDNYRGWDDDLVFGTVHLVEYLELLYTLRKVGYEGWFSMDLFPYREDPSAAVKGSVGFARGIDDLLDRLGVDVVEQALLGDDPLPLLSRIREELLPGSP